MDNEPAHPSEDEKRRTAVLLRDLEGLGTAHCSRCSSVICGHEYVVSVAMGFKNALHCVSCLATALERDRGEFLEQLSQYVESRVCYRTGWNWSSRNEGHGTARRPPCVWPDPGSRSSDRAKEGAMAESEEAGVPAHDAEWNAGDMGCGDLVLELRMKLKGMKPGSILKVTATDLGAPADLPAWCGLTGHTMVAAEHPQYWIQRKED